MKRFAAGLFLFAISAFLLPGLTAQDKADDKKGVANKDAKDENKDQKKDDLPKKTSKTSGKSKSVDPEEEKLLKETVRILARIQNMDANSSGEFSVELTQPFPAKIRATQAWYAQLVQAKAVTQETWNQYVQKMRQSNIIDVRTGQGMKVRTAFPPLEFDLKGNVKRWTQKEIAAAKAGSKLPGFPAQFDALKAGQIVELYVAKIPAKKSAAKDKKKNALDDDPLEDPALKPEILMVLVLREAPQRP